MQQGPYQSKERCQEVAYMLERDRDWVLECIEAPKRRIKRKGK